MIRLILLLFLFVSAASVAENLEQIDYVGTWTQGHPITEGEKSTLRISEEFAVRFTRSFSGKYPDQRFATKADGLRFMDDLAIIDFCWQDGELAYKLVLSGWRVSENRQIFGTMFMYRDGTLFNGLPVSFRIEG